MFIATLFTIAKTWKQPKCPSTEEWINKMWYMCVLSCFTYVWLFVTPFTIAHQAFLSLVLSRQEYCSGLLCPPPGHLPNPGIESRSPAWQVDSLPLVPVGKPFLSSLFWNLSCESIRPLFDRIYKGMSLMWCKPPPRCCQALAVRTVGQVIIVVHLLRVLFVIVLNI